MSVDCTGIRPVPEGSGNVIPLLRCLCGCAAFFDSDRFVHRCRRTPFFAMMRGNRPDATVPAVSGYHSAWERNGLRPVGFSGIHEFTIFFEDPGGALSSVVCG